MPKTVAELMTEYEDSVGHNSNFLLELSPDREYFCLRAVLVARTRACHRW